MTASSSSVRVAVRIRPLTENEKQHCHHNAVAFIPNNQQQVVLGGDRPFTFDYVYPPHSSQQEVYSSCVIPLLNKFIEGYNSTILAYGQTGSGKTYSMGIGLDSVMNASVNDGIVPRFIDSLFHSLESKRSDSYSFQVYVSFLELHNEDLVDLLCPNVKSRREGLNLTIREDSHGNICWAGVREEAVSNPTELMGLLQKGSIARTTASTDMNSTSSRSHAIFSIILKQFQTESDETFVENATLFNQTNVFSPNNSASRHTKRLVSKFHFVDLAGSERLKRTNAVGDRAKEGISINTGLLALGNVISALGDESRRVSHIPYRDSKLTRLLQDSLGGNSQTLMLACASPAVSNMTETLNTLKYANRARNIRNRVVINQELGESDRLKATITRLKEELRSTDDFLRAVNDEMDSLKSQLGSLHQTLDQTTFELASVKYERDHYKHQLNGHDQPFAQEALVQEYATTIESLRGELFMSQQLLKQQQLQQQRTAALLSTTDQNKSVLQIDHIDSSATLVASTASNSTNVARSPLLSKENLSEKTSKKKKHSYRFGSKRAKNGRRRSISSSLNASSNTASPKQLRAMDESNENLILQEARKSMERETEFLESAKISIAHHNSSPWDLKKSDMNTNPKALQYRRRTVDITPPTIPVLQNDHISENKRLLQKLSSAIESKHLLIRQVEKCEKLRVDQVKQLNRKLQETTVKKTTATSQYKRELAELRNQYECRIKKQQADQQVLRRKHMQLISKSDTMRNQNQSVIDQLNKTVEKLTHEKKKLIKRLKLESDRAREKSLENGKEMTKMKRQEAQLVSARKRLERDLMQQKSACKLATEEIVALNGQMKQIAAILKKVLANHGKKVPAGSGITDRNLLAKAAACANVRGYLVKQNAIKKVGGKFKVTSLQQQVYQKKKLIHRAISLYVRNHSTAKAGEELIQKRDRLKDEQKELLAERELIIQEEQKSGMALVSDEPQYMDERIDLITLQVDTLNQQISHILEQKHPVDQLDENNWMDIVDENLQIDLFDHTTDSQVAYEIALSLIRSMQPEEARLVSESLLEDVILLKTDTLTNSTLAQHLNNMLYSLQSRLVQMRRATVGTPFSSSSTYQPSQEGNAAPKQPNISTKSTSLLTPLDTVFMKVLQSPVDIRCGLVLPK
ncbi:P-loop containing nucleoside triphosphate hydrolase protein [Parasitella parasitica]|nr:P-loop containing nucleoside triphosphate hydrolase protein [Parasitella parasitica]